MTTTAVRFSKGGGVHRRDFVFRDTQERPDRQKKSQWTAFKRRRSSLPKYLSYWPGERPHGDSHTWSFHPCFPLSPESSEARTGFQTIEPAARECITCQLYWIWNSLRDHLWVRKRNLPRASLDFSDWLGGGNSFITESKPLNCSGYLPDGCLNTSLPFKVLILL